MRVVKTPYIMDWENNKPDRIRELTSKGKLPVAVDFAESQAAKKPWSVAKVHPFLVGQACGGIDSVKPATQIVNELVTEAAHILTQKAQLVAQIVNELVTE
eukprot:Sspe_Gene.31926::Locus_15682_Transcript_1_1_Confidence_1.000_Length_436::g.31926::m.31926